MRQVRVAMTETINAYPSMPARIEDLDALAPDLDDVREANLAHNVELTEAAVDRGVQLLCLGELFAAPYFALTRHAMWHALAEDAEVGPTVQRLTAVARKHGIILVAPIYELEAASGKRFNTAVVIDEGGEVLGKYRKTHIPQGSNERGSFDERFYYEPSDGERHAAFFPVFATSACKLGVAICYDRHFAGSFASLAKAGAEVVFSPAVTFGAKSRRLWDLEFPVEATRHRMFIGGSNRRGKEAPWNVEYFGASYFTGPGGRLDNASDHADLVIADLDLDSLRGPDSSGWDLARDARPDIYS